MEIALLIHVATTLFMTGLIWFVQVVHYPLFARVGCDGFATYAERHAARTTWIVGPVMSAELVTGVVLLAGGPEGKTLAILIAGMVLLGLIWLSTALLQVPLHERLRRGYTDADQRKLVQGNWIRTAAWSARAILILWLLLPSSS